MSPFRYAPSGVLLAVALVALSGCAALNPLQGVEPGPDAGWSRANASTPRHAAPTPAPIDRATAVEVGPAVRAGAPVLAGAAALAVTLREEGEDWLGIPYRYGGTTRNGIDCSSFVQQMMHEALGLQLTRTTATQVHEGESVDKDELIPGDLVFFRRRGTRHVGVYLGQNEFIHASSSKGVTVSDLSEGYYERHYWTARRVVEDPHLFLASAASGTSQVRQAANRTARVGPRRADRTASASPRSSW